MHAKLLLSCPTLCDPMAHSLPGSSVHETLQARILEWIAISSSTGSSQPRVKPAAPALQSDSLPLASPGSLTTLYEVRISIIPILQMYTEEQRDVGS